MANHGFEKLNNEPQVVPEAPAPEAQGTQLVENLDKDLPSGNEGLRKGLEQKQESSNEQLKNSTEQSPEESITETLGELNSVDRRIFEARKSIAATEQKLRALQKDIGASSANEKSPVEDFQHERLRKLEEERQELAKEKQAWIEENGRENLPEGVALEDGENRREARAGSPEERNLTDEEKREEEEGKQEELEARKEWLKHWEEQAVRDFEKAMREDWWTNDAANLELTIELMKMRVPKAMDKKAEDFVSGKIDAPPFSTVWIRWETFGLLDLILGKPNQIKKLEITFDEDREEIAKEEELVDQVAKEGPEEDAAKNKQKPNISQNPAANKAEGSESTGHGATT